MENLQRINRIDKKINYETALIIKKVCGLDSVCCDIGCHTGEILDEILKASPNGKHYAFEPLPEFYINLIGKYQDTKVQFFDVALSNAEGISNFNYVISSPAYSGFKKRKYDTEEIPTIKEISVKRNKLDNLVKENAKIDFIKIDVEGAELEVLQGAKNIIIRDQPVIIFEHGEGASDFYGTTPNMIFDFFTSLNYKIFLLSEYLESGNFMSLSEFTYQYNTNENYVFCASV